LAGRTIPASGERAQLCGATVRNQAIPTGFLPQRNAINTWIRAYAAFSLRSMRSFAAISSLIAVPAPYTGCGVSDFVIHCFHHVSHGKKLTIPKARYFSTGLRWIRVDQAKSRQIKVKNKL